MRNRTEYLAIAVSLLANALQLAEIALHRLHGMDTQAAFWETLWLGVAPPQLSLTGRKMTSRSSPSPLHQRPSYQHRFISLLL
jgi:hypothetical protein